MEFDQDVRPFFFQFFNVDRMRRDGVDWNVWLHSWLVYL